MNMAWQGAFWGALSAVSLPLGALLGIWLLPPKRVTSALMAFGGGALLFALTIELFGHALHAASDADGHIEDAWLVGVAMLGAAVGGLLFEGLNRGLDRWGAFMRKRSLLNSHVERGRRAEVRRLLGGLSRVEVLRSLPPEEVLRLVQDVTRAQLPAGAVVFREGDDGDALYFVVRGEIAVGREGASTSMATLGVGDVFGEIALVSEGPRTATATAHTAVELLRLPKAAFGEALARSPALQAAVRDLVGRRLDALGGQGGEEAAAASRQWRRQAESHLARLNVHTTEADVAHKVAEHGGHSGAALAIWLGIALDGIPESLVIGMLVLGAAAEGVSMSLAFIVGVFLANLPEAMSSGVTMHRNGARTSRILLMWTSLTVLTAIGGAIGAVAFPAHPEGALAYAVMGIEGMAAGAMLTMIAETMLPEAFEQGGGTITGLSTLGGFLAALSVKLMH